MDANRYFLIEIIIVEKAVSSYIVGNSKIAIVSKNL